MSVVTPTRALALACALLLAGCSTVEEFFSGDKIDYRSQSKKTSALEVPPDLTQLARDGRYQPQSGSVSATAMQAGAQAGAVTAPATAATVAPSTLGDVRIVRDGNQRYLVTTQPPEKLWPELRAFWLERGFTLAVDNAQAGVMETEWAENRAKLPQDGVRALLGKVLDSLYSTSERDRFRTRVERNPAGGSEIYVAHRGLIEVYTNQQRDVTTWQPRPTDPLLEGEFLSRMMVKLGGAKDDASARTVVATATAAPAAPARARLLAGQPGAAMEVDEAFDRAWRRVGLALDRGGFTVEDRDRSAGVYFVRYVDPKLAGQEEPGFFAKLFGADKDQGKLLQRYRLSVKGAGEKTQVAVLNNQGAADGGDAAKQIVARLIDELK
ncbi:outer membrane protein assembly factor BamC [Aquincola sp. S2]|uniref:Outer membrane protein assembly factor BamC n=1 Tax=Pseudaquabacterium terrae TaxID=2732868 RepID=A0ABX2EN61_9BURK|nr:outer membrane protein assembly factor BamC [Aquabacterium terrae]